MGLYVKRALLFGITVGLSATLIVSGIVHQAIVPVLLIIASSLIVGASFVLRKWALFATFLFGTSMMSLAWLKLFESGMYLEMGVAVMVFFLISIIVAALIVLWPYWRKDEIERLQAMSPQQQRIVARQLTLKLYQKLPGIPPLRVEQ